MAHPSEVEEFLEAAAHVSDPVASLRELPQYRSRLAAGLSGTAPPDRARVQTWLEQSAAAAPNPLDEAAAVAPLADFSSAIGLAALRSADALVRSEAANRLGRSQSPEALAPLLATLKDDPDTRVRAAAAQALGHLGDPATTSNLLAALSDAEPEVRRMAAYSLGRLRAASAVPALISATADLDRGVRTSASLALAQIGEPAVAPLLELHAAGESDRAQLALSLMERAELLDPLLAALASERAPLRAAAAEFLVRFREPRVQAALRTALKDPDQRVRHHAELALDVHQRQSEQTNGSAATGSPSAR
jgi:HEAT repeat protein